MIVIKYTNSYKAHNKTLLFLFCAVNLVDTFLIMSNCQDANIKSDVIL